MTIKESLNTEDCTGENYFVLCSLWLELQKILGQAPNLFETDENSSSASDECSGSFSILCSLWSEMKNIFGKDQNGLA